MAEKAKLTLSPGGHVDGQFVLSEDQPCLMCLIMKGNGKYASYFEALEKEDRASRRKPVPEHKLLVEKQASYEDVVFDGRRADGDVALELTTPFAAPNSCEGTATRGLNIKKPMIQHVAWEKDGKTVVAVFNFWEKAPAFFRLKLRGKDLGEFYCGALRTKVYEFGAGAEPRGYTDAELAAWKA